MAWQIALKSPHHIVKQAKMLLPYQRLAKKLPLWTILPVLPRICKLRHMLSVFSSIHRKKCFPSIKKPVPARFTLFFAVAALAVLGIAVGRGGTYFSHMNLLAGWRRPLVHFSCNAQEIIAAWQCHTFLMTPSWILLMLAFGHAKWRGTTVACVFGAARFFLTRSGAFLWFLHIGQPIEKWANPPPKTCALTPQWWE